MSKVEKFEDLVVWKMGREITKEIYGITSVIGQRDFGFCDQIRRAAVSIMNNVAEGYERGSNKDFTRGTLIRVRQDDRMEYRGDQRDAAETGFTNCVKPVSAANPFWISC